MKKYLLLIGFVALTAACNLGFPTPQVESTPQATLPPTRIPATTTPTFIATITNTPIPPLYFTDEFDTASPFWEFQQTGGLDSPQTLFANGALHIDIPSADTWYMGIHNANAYSNVFVRAKVSANAAGSIGLICRYEESTGWFEFNINSVGTYSVLLGQWLSPGIAKYITITSDVSKHIQAGNVASELGLFCEDNILSLYVNDNLIRRLDIANYGITEGAIGITAASYRDAPMTTLFEWVRVSEE